MLDAAASAPAAAGQNTAPSPRSELAEALGALHSSLIESVVTPERVAARWIEIGEVAAAALETTGGFDLITKQASDDATRANSALLDSGGNVDLRIRSDDFFRVRRVADMSPAYFSVELLKLISRVAPDLALAPLALPEIAAIVGSLEQMTSVTCVTSATLREDRQRSVSDALAPTASDKETAARRWRHGHHIFFVATQASAHHMRRAEPALGMPGDEAIRDLDLAALHLRAMSAALWYASAFPSQLYTEHVRPLMQSESRVDEGFSGLDSYDYLEFTFAVEALRVRIAEGNLAFATGLAAERLFEALVEHGEHHVLIAAAMVGTATSLHREADESSARLPAVDILRGMVAEKMDYLDEVRSAVRGDTAT